MKKRFFAGLLLMVVFLTSILPSQALASDVGEQTRDTTELVCSKVSTQMQEVTSKSKELRAEATPVSSQEATTEEPSTSVEATTDVTDVSTAEEMADVALTDSVDDTTCKDATRLLVTSDTALTDTQHATSVVQGYENMYLLTFASPGDCKSAYAYYQTNGYLVDYDTSLSSYAAEDKHATSSAPTETTPSVEEAEDVKTKAIETSLQEAKEKASDVTVAVIDTGADATDVLLNQRLCDGSATEDKNGHGTMMADIIATQTPENVKILALKAFDDTGEGTTSSVYACIKEAMNQKVSIINLSMEGVGTSALLSQAIQEATASGVIVVVSAGNDASDTTCFTPANIPEAIVVSATNEDKTMAAYSNVGNTVDFAATGMIKKTKGTKDVTDDIVYSGTSVAAAKVSSYLALMESKHQDATTSLATISSLAEDLGTVGYDNAYGNGYLSDQKVFSYYYDMEDTTEPEATEPETTTTTIATTEPTDTSKTKVIEPTDTTEKIPMHVAGASRDVNNVSGLCMAYFDSSVSTINLTANIYIDSKLAFDMSSRNLTINGNGYKICASSSFAEGYNGKSSEDVLNNPLICVYGKYTLTLQNLCMDAARKRSNGCSGLLVGQMSSDGKGYTSGHVLMEQCTIKNCYSYYFNGTDTVQPAFQTGLSAGVGGEPLRVWLGSSLIANDCSFKDYDGKIFIIGSSAIFNRETAGNPGCQFAGNIIGGIMNSNSNVYVGYSTFTGNTLRTIPDSNRNCAIYNTEDVLDDKNSNYANLQNKSCFVPTNTVLDTCDISQFTYGMVTAGGTLTFQTSDSNHGRITDNTICGIYSKGGKAVVSSGTISNNQDGINIKGIDVLDANGNVTSTTATGTVLLQGGTVSGNINQGVYLHHSGAAFVMNSGTVSGNQQNGIKVNDGIATITGGSICYNEGHGISSDDTLNVTGSANNMVQMNHNGYTIYGENKKASSGIYTTGGTTSISYANLSQNTSNGIYNHGGTISQVTASTIASNQDNGIRCNNSDIIRNINSSIYDNVDCGIENLGAIAITGGVISNNTQGMNTIGLCQITGGTFSNAKAEGIASSGITEIQNATITGNKTQGVSNAGTMTILGGSFTKNQSNGLTNASTGTLTIRKGNFNQNSENGVENAGNLSMTGGSAMFNTKNGISNQTSDQTTATISTPEPLSSNQGSGIENQSGMLTVNNVLVGKDAANPLTNGNITSGITNSGTLQLNSGTISGNKNQGILNKMNGMVSMYGGIVTDTQTGNVKYEDDKQVALNGSGIGNASGTVFLMAGTVTNNVTNGIATAENGVTNVSSNQVQVKANENGILNDNTGVTNVTGVTATENTYGMKNTSSALDGKEGYLVYSNGVVKENETFDVNQDGINYYMNDKATASTSGVLLQPGEIIHVSKPLQEASIDVTLQLDSKNHFIYDSSNVTVGREVAVCEAGVNPNQTNQVFHLTNQHTNTLIDSNSNPKIDSNLRVAALRVGTTTNSVDGTTDNTDQIILSEAYQVRYDGNIENEHITFEVPSPQTIYWKEASSVTTGNVKVYYDNKELKALKLRGWSKEKKGSMEVIKAGEQATYPATDVVRDQTLYANYDGVCNLDINGNDQTEGENYTIKNFICGTSVLPENTFAKRHTDIIYDEKDDRKMAYTTKYSHQGWSVDAKAVSTDQNVYQPNQSCDLTQEILQAILDGNYDTKTGTVTVTMYAVWDEYPFIKAKNIVFNESVIDSMTEEEMLDRIYAKASATDREDGTLINRKDLLVTDFSKEQLQQFQHTGYMTVTLQATDCVGNVTLNHIRVWYEDQDPVEDHVRGVRRINEHYYGLDDPAQGGLSPRDVWKTNEDYVKEIQRNWTYMNSESATDSMQTWTISNERKKEIQTYMETTGYGDVKTKENLVSFSTKFADCITYTKTPELIGTNQKKITHEIYAGDDLYLYLDGAGAVDHYASSNDAVAPVNEYGCVTGVASGTATITAYGTKGETYTYEVTILPVTIDQPTLTLAVGDSTTLSLTKADILDAASSNEDVAVVNKDGKVTGKKPGTVTIFVTDEYRAIHSSEVTVK